LPFHIVAGALSLVAGFVALSVTKGAPAHRRSGMVFVFAMVPMAITGALIAAWKGAVGTSIGGAMTVYFVLTALATVHPLPGWSRRVDVGLMGVALAVGLTNLVWAFQTVASPTGRREGLPPFPFFMWGIVLTVAAIGDWRMIRSPALRGAARLRRHLWRMCWAMWVATGSFFLGQAKVIPKPIRIMPVLGLLAVTPILALLYWMWRVRRKRGIPKAVVVSADPQWVNA